jgi:hypothetical protein
MKWGLTHRSRASVVRFLDLGYHGPALSTLLLDLRVIVPDDDEAVEVVLGDVAGDVLAGEDGAVERWVELLTRLDEVRQGLEDDEVRTDLGRDFFRRSIVGDELMRGGHIDTVDVGESERARKDT